MDDITYMREGLALAAQALGHTHPNPMVGAVVVRDGRVLGRGFHLRAGEPHAEHVALADAGTDLSGATLYVTLEPCNHQGRTPPCCDAILAAGITRVVVAVADPNPVAHGGIERLRAAGVSVDVGLLEDEARELNAAFFTYHRLSRPMVSVKVATTLDGRIAGADGRSQWITSEPARAEGHALRAAADAVLVGRGTVETDDPALTVRDAPGRDPVRVVLDTHGRLDPARRVFDAGGPRTIHVTGPGVTGHGECWALPVVAGGGIDLDVLLARLADEGMRHVLVESGSGLVSAFLHEGLVDRLHLFLAAKVLGGEGSLPWAGHVGSSTLDGARAFRFQTTRSVGPDLLLTLEATAARRLRVPGDRDIDEAEPCSRAS